MDNVVTTAELIFSLQKRKSWANNIKANFAKSFNLVDWDFLVDLLIAKGFGPH